MIDKKIKNSIKKHSKNEYPKECCGFIIKENDKFKCISTKNISINPEENFEIQSIDFLNIKNKYKKIYYIYHSHTNENKDFSEKDVNCSDILNIPIIMYNTKYDILKIYEPIKTKQEYVGRYYQHGKYDCFKLIEDFYKNELNITFDYDRDFYKKSLTEMNIKDEIFKHFEKNNFEIVKNEDYQINDIFLIDFFGVKDPKHFALYLGDFKILHQPMSGFSKIENYSTFYRKNTFAIFRLKK